MIAGREVGIRWTIGDVTPEGFEALRLAVWGARGAFGPDAAYAVCVNSLSLGQARRRTGDLPEGVEWLPATGRLPDFLRGHVDEGMAEGKAWKFDPVRLFPDRWEISFDNDCILWAVPRSIRDWLEEGDPARCLIAADVAAAHGAFARFGGDQPLNAGIRGIPPGFDLEGALGAVMRDNPVTITSELDEQGLQVAAVFSRKAPVVVTLEEVSICSPFPPHLPHLGRCGAHFVGLNDRWLAWSYYARPATECVREHWRGHREALYERVMGGPAGGDGGVVRSSGRSPPLADRSASPTGPRSP
jgi:hypothetical protein